MKTQNELLEMVIKKDAALTGFKASDLPEAAKARILNTMVSLEKDFSSEELDIIEAWCGKGYKAATFSTSEGECCYYIFADDSLYFRSSGDSEVWAFASDFATDKIIPAYDSTDRPIDKMDAALLNHLGGIYANFNTERQAA
ncbi:MAG: hypothetical protein ACLQU6_03200 [Limisphaerales bacterium]